MVEVVLVGSAVALLDNIEGGQFGQDDLQQTRPLQVFEADAGVGSHDDFVQLHLDALAADNLDAVGHA